MKPYDEFIAHLEGFKEYKPTDPNIIRSGRAICPACGGTNSTKFCISEKQDLSVMAKCFAGCSIYEIVKSVGLELDDLYPDVVFGTNESSHATKGVKGWNWWSLVVALEALILLNTDLFYELTRHLPKNDPANLIIAEIIGNQKEFVEQLKFGRKLK